MKRFVEGEDRSQSILFPEREAQRNLELIWLTGKLVPDFKTIADFRKDNGHAIRGVCREFITLCRSLDLFSEAIVAIDGSKFKAVNNRDKNFTDRKLKARMQQLEESIARYLTELDRADREPALVTVAVANSQRPAVFGSSQASNTRSAEASKWRLTRAMTGGSSVMTWFLSSRKSGKSTNWYNVYTVRRRAGLPRILLSPGHERGIKLSKRHAHTERLAAATVTRMKIGSRANAGPSAMARQMCATTIRPNTVPVVIT